MMTEERELPEVKVRPGLYPGVRVYVCDPFDQEFTGTLRRIRGHYKEIAEVNLDGGGQRAFLRAWVRRQDGLD